MLPKPIEQTLNVLALLRQEVNGIIFYEPKKETCPLDGIFPLGVGSEDNVRADPARVATANEFFQQYPHYKCVHFHTHPKYTVRRLGEYAATHFSAFDIAENREQARRDSAYLALLVTPFPDVKPLWGLDNPQLQRVGDIAGRASRDQQIHAELRRIARERDLDKNPLLASIPQ